MMPSSPSTSAVVPGCRSPAATSADRRRSSSVAPMPQWSRRRRSSARVGDELLVANSTRTPAPRSRATASSTPAMGRPLSQTTPSRSRTQVPPGAGGHMGAEANPRPGSAVRRLRLMAELEVGRRRTGAPSAHRREGRGVPRRHPSPALRGRRPFERSMTPGPSYAASAPRGPAFPK